MTAVAPNKIRYHVPISNNLLDLLKNKSLNKSSLISQGDDYQILFTASPNKARIIRHTSKNLGIKITKIGKITLNNKKSIVIIITYLFRSLIEMKQLVL